MAKKNTKTTELVSQSDPRAPLEGALFLSRAQSLLTDLEADLLSRARGSSSVREALRQRHEAERAAKRTNDPLEIWERHFVTQVAASWLLSCVFVRTLEDRGLLGHHRIAGPGAIDSQRLFFELAPSLTEREYLLTVFRELTRLPAARDLFDARHNPVWLLGPSAEMAKKLLALFRTPNADAPSLRFGQADTRFLGDLYQDLSADVRARFALLQTPHFVEKYILDRTLERAIARFGLDETTLVDPTCGSGHFLLGAFERLLDHRLRKEPGLDVREAARKALDAVYGADINPYAVAIARFRLTLTFLEKAGYAKLGDAPALPLHLVVGDSLLHGPMQRNLGDVAGADKATWTSQEFSLEDETVAKAVLMRTFAAVVGNPPYITVKDAVLRERYREMYPRSAAAQYSLGAPFTERFFLLAKDAGFVGMITANSFMKREFGKKLIESFLPSVNLDGIVNTSGAYIPGHGTPTVLLFGSKESAQGTDVLSVLAKRGEPSTPEDPERGLVWTSIAEHGNEIGFENEYISVSRIPRSALENHPWSLGGGGAAGLKALLEERGQARLGDLINAIGRTNVVGEDDVWISDRASLERRGLGDVAVPFVTGECVRDWAIVDPPHALYPYEGIGGPTVPSSHHIVRGLWPWRGLLERRTVFGKQMKEHGRPWWEHLENYREKLRTPLSIAFAEVATHNHFVLDRGGKVFKQTAPIIKLKEGATEDDHLALLAYLNSSTACFWMKQVCFPKGGDSTGDGGRLSKLPEQDRFAFSATAISSVPIPAGTDELLAYGNEIASLVQERAALSPEVLVADVALGKIGCAFLGSANEKDEHLFRRIVALQEKLDWHVYRLFDLTAESPSIKAELLPEERAFAVHSPGTAAELALIEDRMYKRPWGGRDVSESARKALYMHRVAEAAWEHLAGALETALGTDNSIRAARELERSAAVLALIEKFAGLVDPSELNARDRIVDNAVPFLAALRLNEAGLEKRAAWERVWDLQRAEDRGEKVPPFDPAPKYDQKDFRDATYWRLRGKLDVPKERFISYPGCESDEDKEPVYGWAGWNHLQQAQALAALYQKRKTEESWEKDRLTPILAGLLELIPWLKQWHNEPSAEFGGLRLGDYFETFLDGECHALGLTRDDLRAWRPAEKGRGKKAKAPAKAAVEEESTEAGAAPEPKPKRARRKKEPAQAEPATLPDAES